MIRSLRLRLFLGVTLVSALMLGILGISVDHAIRKTLRQEFDRVLEAKAQSLASMVEQQDEDVHFDYQQSQFPEFEPGPRAGYFEIFLDGQPFRQSPSLAAGHLAQSHPAPAAEVLALPDGRPGRAKTISFAPFLEAESVTTHPKLHTGLLVVAQESADLDRTLDRIRLLTLFLCSAAALLSGAALVAVTGRAIRPVRALASRIESIGQNDLSITLEASTFPTELTPVVDRLNAMLRRLAEAFNRERAFTADAAHELRTPLAGLLATLEVCRTRPRDPAAYETAIDKCLLMLTSMQGLVENLLLLARADGGQLTARTTAIDLPALLRECWQPLEEKARTRGISLHLQDPAPSILPALADPQFLRIVLTNLLENAITYAHPATRIQVRLSAAGPRVQLFILNTGHALAPTDLPHLFTRFWRKDESRSATGRHAGLGLSICRRLLALQNGTISVHLSGDEFTATLELPALTDAPVPSPAPTPPWPPIPPSA